MAQQLNQIGVYRKRTGLSQEEFGEKLNVSKNIVYKWEHEGAPNAFRLLQLVQVFVELGVLQDYEAAKDFWLHSGKDRFPELPELRRMFTQPRRRHTVLSTPPTITIRDGMAYIPAGPFVRGSTPDDVAYFERLCTESCTDCHRDYFEDELPQRIITLAAFYIDVYETTNAQFQRFVAATGYVTTAEINGYSFVMGIHERTARGQSAFVRVSGADWQHPQGPGTSIEDRMNHPVVHVSWEDATAYATWVSKRLPTEAEWEKACRGPDGRLFPWGDVWDPYAGNYVRVDPDGLGYAEGTQEVGQYPQGISVYGVHDMLGNVSEWVADLYDPDYYAIAPERNPYNSVVGSSIRGVQHVRRGGGWATRPGYLHAAWRIDRPDNTNDNCGFRCARYP
jgi:formylglycine-generating enzyme